MNIGEYIRIKILNDPMKMKRFSGYFEFFFDELTNNTKFLVFVLFIGVLGILFSYMLSKQSRQRNIMFVCGMFLVGSAFVLKNLKTLNRINENLEKTVDKNDLHDNKKNVNNKNENGFKKTSLDINNENKVSHIRLDNGPDKINNSNVIKTVNKGNDIAHSEKKKHANKVYEKTGVVESKLKHNNLKTNKLLELNIKHRGKNKKKAELNDKKHLKKNEKENKKNGGLVEKKGRLKKNNKHKDNFHLLDRHVFSGKENSIGNIFFKESLKKSIDDKMKSLEVEDDNNDIKVHNSHENVPKKPKKVNNTLLDRNHNQIKRKVPRKNEVVENSNKIGGTTNNRMTGNVESRVLSPNTGSLHPVDTINHSISVEENSIANDKNNKNREYKYLEKIKDLLTGSQINGERYNSFIADLDRISAKVSENIQKLTVEMNDFLKDSKIIEKEMNGFNVSIKYINLELNNYFQEIGKYFSILNNFKPVDPNVFVIDFISEVLNTQNRINNGSKFDSKRLSDTYGLYGGIRIIFMVIAISMIILLLLMILNIYNSSLVSKICIFITFVFILLFCMLVFLQAHVFDMKCKSGNVKGCEDSLKIGDLYTNDLEKTKMNEKINRFEVELRKTGEKYKPRIINMKSYIDSLITANPNNSRTVFENIFDKINFVKEEFDNITGQKIDSNKYYSRINRIMTILIKIDSILKMNLKNDIIEIYVNDRIFLSNLEFQGNEPAESIRRIVARHEERKKNNKLKRCLKNIETFCKVKTQLDNLYFLLIVILVIVTFVMML